MNQQMCLCGAVTGRDRHAEACPFPLFSNRDPRASLWWAKYKDRQDAADRRRRAAANPRKVRTR